MQWAGNGDAVRSNMLTHSDQSFEPLNFLSELFVAATLRPCHQQTQLSLRRCKNVHLPPATPFPSIFVGAWTRRQKVPDDASPIDELSHTCVVSRS
jgi:hypothetical protein